MNSDQAHDSPVPERLRIAFVVDRFGNRFGGAEAYGVELMRELRKRSPKSRYLRVNTTAAVI